LSAIRSTILGNMSNKRIRPGWRRLARGIPKPYTARCLCEALGLTDYLADRLAIAGPVEACVERLRDLKKLGVEQLWSPVRFADKAPLMRAICEDLMPHLAQL
jgi:hypothetical protein